mgnify:FL=1
MKYYVMQVLSTETYISFNPTTRNLMQGSFSEVVDYLKRMHQINPLIEIENVNLIGHYSAGLEGLVAKLNGR